jgi:hypothetical protein
MLKKLPLLLLALCCAAAQGQSLYKCTVKGKITYSGAPCKEGEEKAIDVPPVPEVDTKLAAERERQKVALTSLENARSEREKLERKQQGERGVAVNEQRCAKLRQDQQTAEENANSAPGKLKASLREKALRMGEALAQECKS